MRYFVAVAEAFSFTNAAKNLRLAQPSLTRQVKNLEDELGVRLLDRGNNRVTLTDEGDLFLVESKKILAMCGQSVAAVQRMKHSGRHQINIGYVAAIHHGILASTLAAFRKISPTVVLNLFDMTSAEQFEGLESRRIDLGFVGLNPALSSDNLTFHCIAYDTILVVLPEHHPLSSETKIELTKLKDQFFVGMSAKTHPGARDWLLQTCRAAGFDAKVLQ